MAEPVTHRHRPGGRPYPVKARQQNNGPPVAQFAAAPLGQKANHVGAHAIGPRPELLNQCENGGKEIKKTRRPVGLRIGPAVGAKGFVFGGVFDYVPEQDRRDIPDRRVRAKGLKGAEPGN